MQMTDEDDQTVTGKNNEFFGITDEEYERLKEERNQIIADANEKFGHVSKNGNGDRNGKSSGSFLDDKPSIAEKLIGLITQNSNLFFKDQHDTPFARIHNTDHYEIVRVGSDRFKRYLCRLYYESENKVANTEALTNAVQVLQAKAEYKGDTIPLSLRIAWNNGNLLYDLTNEKWQCVRVTKECWHLLDETPTPMFMKYNQITQVQPNSNYEPDIFDKFLELTNLKREQDRILLKVYIASLFIPDIPHTMLILHGEQGSAKSTLQTLIKKLVDPSKPTLLTIHNNRTEFVQQLAHNHVAYYDNVKRTPRWLSDEACKAVTGIGQTKRKLYSDDDDIVYEYKRCLGFNGINISLTEPDVLDRSLLIELDRVPIENRKIESDINAEFMKLRPMLLGYIFDILVKVLQIISTVKLDDLPRMADFALWGEAIARAMGYRELEFIDAYYGNIHQQNIEAVESYPIAQAVEKFVDSWYKEELEACWQGSTSKLLQDLNKVAQRYRYRY